MFSAGNLSPLVREIKPSVVSNGQEMSGEDWDRGIRMIHRLKKRVSVRQPIKT